MTFREKGSSSPAASGFRGGSATAFAFFPRELGFSLPFLFQLLLLPRLLSLPAAEFLSLTVQGVRPL
jgi:hypothetical protein